MDKRRTCLVALSGGVDSTITAYLLKKEGYHVEGLYLELLGSGFEESVRTQKERVLEIGDSLGIRVHFLDLRREFHETIISYFIEAYKRGLTPNPCTLCNPLIKFRAGLSTAKSLGLEHFATGHYVRKGTHPRLGCVLMKGADPKKDQSYFLYRLRPEWLQSLIFPLGEKTKEEVRTLAKRLGLSQVVLEESQEVCFVKGDYRELVYSGEIDERPGPIVFKRTGEVLGRHKGIFNYTIGQRRGLGIPGPEPYYVVQLDVEGNRVYIGTKKDTLRRSFFIEQANWLVPEDYVLKAATSIKIRSRHMPAPGRVMKESRGHGRYKIVFDEPQSSVTPGQAAVVYEGDILLGGGVICS